MPAAEASADLVGTSLVESGVVKAEAYIDAVETLIARFGADRYFAHRKEADWKLDLIARMGVEVARPALPLGIVARRGPIGRTIVSFLPPWCTPCRQCWPRLVRRLWCARSRRSGTSLKPRWAPMTSWVASPRPRGGIGLLAVACLVLTLGFAAGFRHVLTDPVRMNPQAIAIIPARGGSKGVPGKNLRRVGGRSLVERAVDACRAARLVHTIYVSTDDVEIAARAEAAGAKVIMRPVELASDTASSESALLHALHQLLMVGEEPEVLVFVQCTSPFIAPDDLDRGIELIIPRSCRLGLLGRSDL